MNIKRDIDWLLDKLNSMVAMVLENVQNNEADAMDYILVEDDGEPVPEITVEEIERAQAEYERRRR